MLNEWKEFLAYTGAVNYTARNKQDTTYLATWAALPSTPFWISRDSTGC